MEQKEIDLGEITKEGKLPVTKIDAAVRQLETAITLWFHDADPVSIATLTYAGYQIISDLNKQRNGASMILDIGNEHIRPEYQKAYRRLLRSTPNFFKHADQDPQETHYFATGVTELVLFEATNVYSSWKLEKRPLFTIFTGWITMIYPNIFEEDYINQLHQSAGETDSIVYMGKKWFYDHMLTLSMQIC